MALFGGYVPFSPVYDVGEIFADEHFRTREMLVEVEQPGSQSPVTIAGVPVKLSRTPGSVRHRAPLLGEHTDELLTALGFAGDTIVDLRSRNVVK
jgi:crotonobetainyl-CoA:carnitine CoA-transferase CaiB-like acyl-CoA transferase